MEDRKQRKEKAKLEKKDMTEVKTNKYSRGILKYTCRTLYIIMNVCMIAVLAMVMYLKVLPNKFLIPLLVGVALLDAIGLILSFKKKGSNVVRLVMTLLFAVLTTVFTFAGLKLGKTLSFVKDMSTETVNAKKYYVLVLNDSKYEKIEDIQYKLVLYYSNELGNTETAIEKLKEAITIVVQDTNDVHELANKLISKEVDAILIEDSYYAIIEEEIEDFKDKTKEIYSFALEDVIETIAKEVSVTKEPFTVFISGIDSYGTINSVSRSDVNMIATVNPQTKQVLLVSIPRDYYVKLHGTSGYRDKLTHAGIYGVDMSVKTVEDLFDIDINYYVRVNFTSLIKIIDAIGGVNVYSKYSFTSKIGGYKFKEGYNQINGKQALAFARERYSFAEGDRMRGQNQQAVIDAMIKKVCSSATILTKFDALLDSLKGSFQTNMDYTKMVELVRMQISDNAEWNVTSISVDGAGSSERTYSMGKTRLYVMIPYAGSITKAEDMINDVLKGTMLDSGHIDLSKYNDRLVVPRGTYPDEEKPAEKPAEPEVPEEPEDPVVPETPPEDPVDPEDPEVPETPETPEEPEVPETPEDPVIPPEDPIDPKPVDPYNE